MSSTETDELERRLKVLTTKADTLEHDVKLLRKIFTHIDEQFESFKKDSEQKK